MMVEENPSDYDYKWFWKKINVNINTSQMEQCSILGNAIDHVQYNRNPIDY